jgi:hypothetical protein
VRKVFSCDICRRTFHDQAHTHCAVCHSDLEVLGKLQRKLAPALPQLWERSCLGAACWALGLLVKRAESAGRL